MIDENADTNLESGDVKRSGEAMRQGPQDEISALVTEDTRGRSLLPFLWKADINTPRRALTSLAMLSVPAAG